MMGIRNFGFTPPPKPDRMITGADVAALVVWIVVVVLGVVGVGGGYLLFQGLR